MATHSDPPPTPNDLRLALSDLAERVAADRRPMLGPIERASLRRIVFELERQIPGLDPPPDAAAARNLASSAAAALFHNHEREALARSLKGLSHAPHDPELHYLTASACLELGAVREAVCLLTHTLWIHPGHPGARRDLEALTACRGVLGPPQGPVDDGAEPALPLELYEQGIPEGDPDQGFWTHDGAWMDDPAAREDPADGDDGDPEGGRRAA